MAAPNPLSEPSSPSSVSKSTLFVAGILVDVYGLSELPPTATSVSCLWLHHPRLNTREGMADFADSCLSAWHAPPPSSPNADPGKRSSSSSSSTNRGLVAVAFDQRNHGSRLVPGMEVHNESWRAGNATHAQDMFSCIAGMVTDTQLLMDVLEAHIFAAAGEAERKAERKIDQHLVLGVSLGGHSAWQLMFAEPRVTAAVVVIGCPDYMHLLSERARKSKLKTYEASHPGRFLGGKDFPESLVAACAKRDPRGILFGTGGISDSERDRLRPLLDTKIKGKKFQVLSGADDKIVPPSNSKPFMDFFTRAAGTWYKGSVYVEDNVYPGVGHSFNSPMMKDATRFIIDTVSEKDTDMPASKI